VKTVNFFLKWVFVPLVAATVVDEGIAAGLWLANLHSDVAVFVGMSVVLLSVVSGISFAVWFIARIVDAVSGNN
jgi:hypothetical protein